MILCERCAECGAAPYQVCQVACAGWTEYVESMTEEEEVQHEQYV